MGLQADAPGHPITVQSGKHLVCLLQDKKQRYLAHLICLPDKSIGKRMLFNADISVRPGRGIAFIKSALGGLNIHQFEQEALMKKI